MSVGLYLHGCTEISCGTYSRVCWFWPVAVAMTLTTTAVKLVVLQTVASVVRVVLQPMAALMRLDTVAPAQRTRAESVAKVAKEVRLHRGAAVALGLPWA